MSLRLLPLRLRAFPGERILSNLAASDVAALDSWIDEVKRGSHTFHDVLAPSKLADLYCTLPTKAHLHSGAFLREGHSLAFFHRALPESALAADATDPHFCPPPPFSRRMWASGGFRWHAGLRAGSDARATARVVQVEKKGFARAAPMVFVHQEIEHRHDDAHACVTERRTHVYLPQEFIASKRSTRDVSGLPRPDFSFSWTPTPTTLFRFSALTFNAHLIHLDRDYARKTEGYLERLVHGPLTALMMLEVTRDFNPDARFMSFEYRAENPVVVNQQQWIHGAYQEGGKTVKVWAVDVDGVVGMTGQVIFGE